MAELIINQQNIETRSTTDNTNDKNGFKDHRISSDAFLIKVSQCIKIANTIRDDVRSQIVSIITQFIFVSIIVWNRYFRY
jgi:hypothetical protein